MYVHLYTYVLGNKLELCVTMIFSGKCCMYAYVCISEYISTYIYLSIFLHIYVYLSIFLHISWRWYFPAVLYVCICMYICVYFYIYTRYLLDNKLDLLDDDIFEPLPQSATIKLYIHTYILSCTYIHTFSSPMHVCIYLYICILGTCSTTNWSYLTMIFSSPYHKAPQSSLRGIH